MTLREAIASLPGITRRPPLSEAELRDIESRWPKPMPGEVREMLRFASGLELPEMGHIEFTGRSWRFEFRELIPFGVPIAERGGNFWIVDVDGNGAWGSIFFFSHDPPTAIIQFDSLHMLLEQLASPRDIVDQARQLSGAVWDQQDLGVTVADATRSDDTVLRSFALTLPPEFRIFDLRQRSSPRGFIWGSNGPASACHRAGLDMLFAVEAKTERPGFWSRVMGR